MIIASYGGGTNSTAMLIECAKRGIKIDLILFADTGGERPNTYKYIETFSEWCISNGLPEITIIHPTQPQQIADGSLENECLRLRCLPSRTYGYGSCSMKWKRDPQDKYVRSLDAAQKIWASGEKITKLIGFDADEPQRSDRVLSLEEKHFSYRCPLVEWNMGREECLKTIEDAGLCSPGKSACFFCPSSKPTEIRHLAAVYPDLFSRALKMEANAELNSIKGLGRNFAWYEVISQTDMFPDEYTSTPEIACGCYDG